MTSGEFTSVDPDFIWVDRTKRQRRELLNIGELAASISHNGLIHPPVIRRDGELIVGERRWTAIKSLGWTSVPIQWVDTLDEIELHALEFEENVSREDISWQEQCLAVEHYHKLRLSQDPNWTATKTGERLGIAVQNVLTKQAVAQAIESGNIAVTAAPKFSTARNIVARASARKRASAIDSITEGVTNKPVEHSVPLLLEDFHDWSDYYTGAPFNLIHCDFPYGVGMDKSDQGARAEWGSYADSPDVYWRLIDTLGASMANVVAPSAHLMFWFSMDYYTETKQLLEKQGWRINPFPLVWVKSDNTGIIPDHNRQPRRIYETCFFGSRGDRFIHTPVSNAFPYPGREKSIHMNEKPVPMLKHFMRMFCDENSSVLDPTCGSGNALKAATACGARTVLGLERDSEFYQRAKEAYFDDSESISPLDL